MNREAAEALLLARGFTLTAQRRAILAFLDGNETHPTAAEIFAAVTRDFPMASRATVYNTLALLEESGAVGVLRDSAAEARFDPNVTHHHHMVCPDCGRITDVQPEAVSVLLHGKPALGRVRFETTCTSCVEVGHSL